MADSDFLFLRLLQDNLKEAHKGPPDTGIPGLPAHYRAYRISKYS